MLKLSIAMTVDGDNTAREHKQQTHRQRYQRQNHSKQQQRAKIQLPNIHQRFVQLGLVRIGTVILIATCGVYLLVVSSSSTVSSIRTVTKDTNPISTKSNSIDDSNGTTDTDTSTLAQRTDEDGKTVDHAIDRSTTEIIESNDNSVSVPTKNQQTTIPTKTPVTSYVADPVSITSITNDTNVDSNPTHIPTPTSHPPSSSSSLFFLQEPDIDLSDMYSGMWWVPVTYFQSNVSTIAMDNLESATFATIINNTNIVRMTYDFLDFAVEHMSIYIRELNTYQFPELYPYYYQKMSSYVNRTILHHHNRIFEPLYVDVNNNNSNKSNTNKNDDDPGTGAGDVLGLTSHATIAIVPFGTSDDIQPDEYALHLQALEATIVSLYHIGIGRVVVVSYGEKEREHVVPMLDDLTERIGTTVHQYNGNHKFKHNDPTLVDQHRHSNIGQIQLAFVNNNIPDNKILPKHAIQGLQDALSGKFNSHDTYEWLGCSEVSSSSSCWWDYVYFSEPDLIVYSTDRGLRNVHSELQLGRIIIAHRLQLIVHEADYIDALQSIEQQMQEQEQQQQQQLSDMNETDQGATGTSNGSDSSSDSSISINHPNNRSITHHRAMLMRLLPSIGNFANITEIDQEETASDGNNVYSNGTNYNPHYSRTTPSTDTRIGIGCIDSGGIHPAQDVPHCGNWWWRCGYDELRTTTYENYTTMTLSSILFNETSRTTTSTSTPIDANVQKIQPVQNELDQKLIEEWFPRLVPYDFMRLRHGTGFVLVSGTHQGRKCDIRSQ